jgi:hypothetical protein
LLKTPEKKEFDGGPSKTDLVGMIKELESTARHAEAGISDLVTRDPFKSLFAVDGDLRSQIEESIRSGGYDRTQPVIVWTEGGCVIDGHTRLEAAAAAGLETVPVEYKSFTDEEEVLSYVFGLQFRRRNLSDADRLSFLVRFFNNAVGKSPESEKRGKGRPKNQFNREDVAALMSVSLGTAQKYVNVISSGDAHLVARVLGGDISINKANSVLAARNSKDPGRQPSNVWRAKKFAAIVGDIVKEMKADADKYTCEDAITRLLGRLAEERLISQKTYAKVVGQGAG